MSKPPIEASSATTEGHESATNVSAKGRKTGRGRLDLDLILKTGAELIEDESIHQLSMRNLAARLGVQAMSLYRYVPSRDVLIDGIVDLVLQDLENNPEVPKTATDGWEDFIRRLSYGFRKVAHEHPQVFPVVATRPPEAPWIRPPMRSLTWIDRFLGALRENGFSEDSAVRAYRAYSSFLLGHLLLELAGEAIDISDVGPDAKKLQDTSEKPSVSLDEYPYVQELESRLKENHSAEEFDRALDQTVAWIGQLSKR